MVKLAPSILSADFGRLAEEVAAAEAAGADWIHVDVMDGHFVPNLTIGPMITEVVRRATSLPVDVHLMIEKPERYLEAFASAGASMLTVHQETCPHLHRTVERIRELGVRAGVCVNPATPVDTLTEVLPYVDLVLVMSVNPGFGGQRYIPISTDKIRRARYLLDRQGHPGADLQVDGGIDAHTAVEAVRAGASCLVAGTAVFRHPEGVAAGLRALRELLAGVQPSPATVVRQR
ncbi:MAG: ribulose-phosphate 3-epimerase [Gemmatimonadetes bacterium]|nr:ribulose-phosphate 3-epimerase [Gemmatimonadota bacterium]